MQSLETGTNKNSGSLHEEVLSKIRQMILQGELEPGSRIVERSLCERFKVSRTPLREAFKVLRSEGLVEILPNRGARVPTFRKKEICDAMEIMAALEGLAGELAEIIASVGLAQNLAALRALATEGIQQGHMSLHARQVAIAAGAKEDQVRLLAEQLVKEKQVRIDRAIEILAKWNQS